jgi:hypothetical protein
MWGALSDDGTGLLLAAYNCCWPSPAQSFLGSRPARLMTIFYCLRFETPPTWRARSPYLYPPVTGWPSYTPRHWAPFSSPPTARRATVEVFEPASTRVTYFFFNFLICLMGGGVQTGSTRHVGHLLAYCTYPG